MSIGCVAVFFSPKEAVHEPYGQSICSFDFLFIEDPCALQTNRRHEISLFMEAKKKQMRGNAEERKRGSGLRLLLSPRPEENIYEIPHQHLFFCS